MEEVNWTFGRRRDLDAESQENLYKTLREIVKGDLTPLWKYIHRCYRDNKGLISNTVIWPKIDKELTINELKAELMQDKNLKLFLIAEEGNFIFHPQIRNTKKFAIARYKGKELAITNRQNIVFKVDSSLLSEDYLSLLFQSEFIEFKLFFLAGSGLQGGISGEEFNKLPIKVPSLELQQKFINTYELIEEAIKTKKQINEELENIMFSHFQKIQKDYSESIKRLREIYSITVGGIFPEDISVPKSTIEIPGLNREQIVSQDRKFISEFQNFLPPSNDKNYKLPKVPANSIVIVKMILMNIASTAQKIISNVSIVKKETHLHQELCALYPSEEIGLYYGYFLIKSNIESLSQKANITRTRYALSKQTIEDFEVNIVEKEKICEFNDFCKPLFELQNCNEEIIKELKHIQKCSIEYIASSN